MLSLGDLLENGELNEIIPYQPQNETIDLTHFNHIKKTFKIESIPKLIPPSAINSPFYKRLNEKPGHGEKRTVRDIRLLCADIDERKTPADDKLIVYNHVCEKFAAEIKKLDEMAATVEAATVLFKAALEHINAAADEFLLPELFTKTERDRFVSMMRSFDAIDYGTIADVKEKLRDELHAMELKTARIRAKLYVVEVRERAGADTRHLIHKAAIDSLMGMTRNY